MRKKGIDGTLGIQRTNPGTDGGVALVCMLHTGYTEAGWRRRLFDFGIHSGTLGATQH